MEKKSNRKQNTVLYISLVFTLTILAIVIGVANSVAKHETDNSKSSTNIEHQIPESSAGNTTESETEKTEDADLIISETIEPDTESVAEINEVIDADAAETASTDVLPEFINPTGGYLINENSDTVPVFSVTMNDYRTHTGVDISANSGDPVYAAADGVIGAVWDDPLMGRCITVVHNGGAVTSYKGLSPEEIEGISQGVNVKSGQIIGAASDSALIEVSEEPHLHFEMCINGENVDPCKYISMEYSPE